MVMLVSFSKIHHSSLDLRTSQLAIQSEGPERRDGWSRTTPGTSWSVKAAQIQQFQSGLDVLYAGMKWGNAYKETLHKYEHKGLERGSHVEVLIPLISHFECDIDEDLQSFSNQHCWTLKNLMLASVHRQKGSLVLADDPISWRPPKITHVRDTFWDVYLKCQMHSILGFVWKCCSPCHLLDYH